MAKYCIEDAVRVHDILAKNGINLDVVNAGATFIPVVRKLHGWKWFEIWVKDNADYIRNVIEKGA